MNPFKITIILFLGLFASCATTNLSVIATGNEQFDNTRFIVKHLRDGCCGCAGVLVDTYKLDKLQSQLFIESNSACPYNWTKFNFTYLSNGSLSKIDTLIAVDDSSFTYPITNTDKIALSKVDSFILTQNSTYYRIRKIDIKGYRNLIEADKGKIYFIKPLINKKDGR
jgi:hypothetical protein